LHFFKNNPFIKILSFLFLVSTLVLSIYLYGVFQKIENKYKIDTLKQNELEYRIIHRNLINTKKDIEYISKLYKFFNDNNNYTNSEKLKLFSGNIKRLIESKKVYSQVRFIGIDGYEIARIDYKDGKSKVIDEKNLQNKYSRYYFKESLNLKDGEIYISKFDLNKENAKVEIPYNPTLRLSTPVTDRDNKIIGYVVINYLGSDILTELNLYAKDIDTLLLNKDTHYLVGFTPEDEWSFMFGDDTSFKKSYPYIWDSFKNKQISSINHNGIQFSLLSINPVEIVSPNRNAKSRREWILVSYVENEKIYGEFYKYIDSIKILIGIFGLLIVIFSYLLATYMKKMNLANIRMEIADEVFKNTIEGIMVVDANTKIIQVNKAFTDITGYSETNVYGKKPNLLKGEFVEESDTYKNMWKSITEKGHWNGELTNQTRFGEKYISKLSIGVVKESGKILYYIGVFSNVTKQIEDKRELERTALALKNSLEDLQKAQNKLIESEKLTALGELIAGISHEINSPLGAIKSSSENVIDSVSRVIKEVPKLASLLNDDEKILFEKLKSSIPLESSFLSIKEQRELRKKIKLQLDELGVESSRYFADKFSQFNVENIVEYKSLILHKDAKFIINTLFDEYSTISNMYNIKRSIDRASKTIFALKKFAHFDHDREGVIEKIEDSITNVLVLFNHNLKQGIEVVRKFDDVEPLYCYSDELSQVWMNLVSNSIHAMPNGGILAIAIYDENEYQVVSISDTGHGIPKDIQQKVFEPFFTTKKSGEGSGIGLDIVKKVVDAHGGKIELHSDTNGTEFKIYISKNVGK